jgi:fructose-1,6-bisphosphatase I
LQSKTLEETLSEVASPLSEVILTISRLAQEVSRELPFRLGEAQTYNPSGERQAELDIYANDLFVSGLVDSGLVRAIASEELTEPVESSGRFSIAMDPLDGSSNITTNNPLGSIFGIYEGKIPSSGEKQVASVFITYGPILTLTYTIRNGVNQFVEVRKGPLAGKYVLAYENIRLPQKPSVYGFGGLRNSWIPPVRRFVESLEERGFKLRYGGTLVGDYNQIIKFGGIFAYPALLDNPKGKLRLLYETAPIGLITEQAGGAASDGVNRLLSIIPTSLNQVSPAYIGNKELVRELEDFLQESLKVET